MNTITIWILIFAGSGYRPAAVIDRFPTAETCQAAAIATKQWTDSSVGNQSQFPLCLKATVVVNSR